MCTILYWLNISCCCKEKYCDRLVNMDEIVLEEERSKVEIINQFKLPLQIVKTDERIPALKTPWTKLCDFLMVDVNKNNHYYIELKWVYNYQKSFEQIQSVFEKLYLQKGYSCNNRYAVVSLSFLTYNPDYVFFLWRFKKSGWKTDYIKTTGSLYNLINQSPIKVEV